MMENQQIRGTNLQNQFQHFSTDPGFIERSARFSCFANKNLVGFNEITPNLDNSKGHDHVRVLKQSKDNSKPPEAPKDYIPARARSRRVQASTLAERVRRDKISERMKILQDIVPGCNKVTGEAVKLDEIINYVQSLQRQVEFLSMKLATVNPRAEFNVEALVSKDIFQSRGSLPQNLHFSCNYPFQSEPSLHNAISNGTEVRKEKSSERMKVLQDLVPGCNKVIGKVAMLDEIIYYVQSLQRQVEFLSMKLAFVNPRTDFNVEALVSKNIFQSCGSLPQNMYSSDSYPSQSQSRLNNAFQNDINAPRELIGRLGSICINSPPNNNNNNNNVSVPIDQNDPFGSALSSMVSSPTHTSSNGNEVNNGENTENNNDIVLRELIGRFGSISQFTSEEIEHQVDSGRNNLDTTEESKKERNETSFNISYEVLAQHFGKKIDDVIEELGVSRSTFKRIIRSHGIARWPSNAKNKKNPSIFEASNGNKRVRGNRQETLVSSSNSTPPCLDQNVLLNNDIIGSSQNHIELPKTDDAVIIKATFGDDTVKIQFCISSNMERLVEEVVRRFNLTVGSFKLKYFDEDDEWMLLARDDDLKLCIKTLTSLGKKTPIKVSVQSI